MKRMFVLFLLPVSVSAAVPFVPGGKNELVKAVIASVETEATVTVQFNPKELTIDKPVPWQKHKNSEGDAPTLEFTAADPKTLNVELFFDLFEDRGNVYAAYVKPLESMAMVVADLKRPPMVTFTWGSNFPLFRGVIESLNVKYTLFLPDGTPCRATVNMSMREAHKLLNRREAEEANGGDTCSTDNDCGSGETCQSGTCTK